MLLLENAETSCRVTAKMKKFSTRKVLLMPVNALTRGTITVAMKVKHGNTISKNVVPQQKLIAGQMRYSTRLTENLADACEQLTFVATLRFLKVDLIPADPELLKSALLTLTHLVMYSLFGPKKNAKTGLRFARPTRPIFGMLITQRADKLCLSIANTTIHHESGMMPKEANAEPRLPFATTTSFMTHQQLASALIRLKLLAWLLLSGRTTNVRGDAPEMIKSASTASANAMTNSRGSIWESADLSKQETAIY